MDVGHRKDRRIAYECDTFKKMVEKDSRTGSEGTTGFLPEMMCQSAGLKEGFKEGQTNEIQLPTITGKLLEKAFELLKL